VVDAKSRRAALIRTGECEMKKLILLITALAFTLSAFSGATLAKKEESAKNLYSTDAQQPTLNGASADCASLQTRIAQWEKRKAEFLTRVKEFAARRDEHNAHAREHNARQPYISKGQANAYNAEAEIGNNAKDRINANRDTLRAELDSLNNEGNALKRELEECARWARKQMDGPRLTNRQIGDAAEDHFTSEAKKKGYLTVLTAKNPSGHGVDAFMYDPKFRRYIVAEIKANSSRLSKNQRLGPIYALERLLEAAEGGRWWRNVSPKDRNRAEEALRQLLSGESRPDILFLVVRYDVNPNTREVSNPRHTSWGRLDGIYSGEDLGNAGGPTLFPINPRWQPGDGIPDGR
jgi:hypothetical protein